jgi:hypothetical protein
MRSQLAERCSGPRLEEAEEEAGVEGAEVVVAAVVAGGEEV